MRYIQYMPSFFCIILTLDLPSYHLYSLGVERLYEDSSACGHALHQLVERRTFDLLPFQVSHAVQEIKQHAALLQLLTEQVVQLCHRGVWTVEREEEREEERGTLDMEVKQKCSSAYRA